MREERATAGKRRADLCMNILPELRGLEDWLLAIAMKLKLRLFAGDIHLASRGFKTKVSALAYSITVQILIPREGIVPEVHLTGPHLLTSV